MSAREIRGADQRAISECSVPASERGQQDGSALEPARRREVPSLVLSAQRAERRRDGARMSDPHDDERAPSPRRPRHADGDEPSRDALVELLTVRATPVPEKRPSARGVEALRHYVIAWGPPRPSKHSPLGELEDRVLRYERIEQLDNDLPAGCTIAGAIVDELSESPDAVELLAATRRRWPRVLLMLVGRRRTATELRALRMNGIVGVDLRASDLYAQMRAFVSDAVTERLAHCAALETRMASWDLTEKEAQMLALLALGLDEASLPAALESSAAYIAMMRRSVLEKTEAQDLYGVMARLIR